MEEQASHPFQRWVDAARPREQLWRTTVGVVIAVTAWIVWSMLLLLIAVGGGLIERGTIAALFGEGIELGYTELVVMLLVTFATIWGLGFGVWAALRLMHKRGLASVYSGDGRIDWRQFLLGCAIAAVYLALSLGWSVVSGNVPRRSDIEIGNWLMAFAPLVVVIFFQATSEELLFRGYLPQQLAARFRSPIVWGFLPTLAFGAMHAGNAIGDPSYMAYYVVSATLLGLVMMATVWRTGGIAVAMGIHVVNNIAALTVAGVDNGPSSLSLFVWSQSDLMRSASSDVLFIGLLLAFILSPWAPLPKGQALMRRNETRAAP